MRRKLVDQGRAALRTLLSILYLRCSRAVIDEVLQNSVLSILYLRCQAVRTGQYVELQFTFQFSI